MLNAFKYASHLKEFESDTVYRQVSLRKEYANEYNLGRLKYFSWFSFTSTSTNKAKTERFGMSNDPNKITVLFTIKFSPTKIQHEMLNLKTVATFDENEYLIRPGSIFELISSKYDK